MLQVIIFIRDVYISLLEQDHQKEAAVQERYKMYKNTATYKNAIQLEYKVDNIWNSTVFAKKSEAGQLPEICLLGAASTLTLTPLPGSDDGNEKLSWSPMSRLWCLDRGSKGNKVLSRWQKEVTWSPMFRLWCLGRGLKSNEGLSQR